MNFANAYTRKEERSKSWATINNEESMTQQSDAIDTDINVIMAKYKQTGQLPQQLTQPLFGDFTDTLDYRTAVTTIRAAEEAFLEIPAEVREQFGNDPGRFIQFASDPKNKEKMREMGLLIPTPQPTIEEQTLEAIRELKPKPADGPKP